MREVRAPCRLTNNCSAESVELPNVKREHNLHGGGVKTEYMCDTGPGDRLCPLRTRARARTRAFGTGSHAWPTRSCTGTGTGTRMKACVRSNPRVL
jgi:hypothetical protein